MHLEKKRLYTMQDELIARLTTYRERMGLIHKDLEIIEERLQLVAKEEKRLIKG